MDLILSTNYKLLINKNKNKFFEDLYLLMNNNLFREFFNKYFTSWDEINTIILYLKLYETIEYFYRQKYNKNINKNHINILLYNLFINSILRKIILNNYELYKSSGTKLYLDIKL